MNVYDSKYYKSVIGFYSDHRSTVAPSDSERDVSSGKKPRDPAGFDGGKWPHPTAGIGLNQDSESGGSQPPSPRASRRRHVSLNNLFIDKKFKS